MTNYNETISIEVISALGGKDIIRSADYNYFHGFRFGDLFKGKQIHHDWEDGARCYILNAEIRKEYHGKKPYGGIEGL